MRQDAKVMLCVGLVGATVATALAVFTGRVRADDPNSAPNPYHVVDNWAKLPEGRHWGMAIGVDIDRDGTSVWVFDRCGGKTCDGSNVAPVQKFDASGRLVVAFGSGLFSWPHGLFATTDGTLWVTDGQKQVVVQPAPDGRVLRTLGKAGVPATVPIPSIRPSGVLIAPHGEIFVADGHGVRHQCPHREILEGRQVHQGVGPERLRSRRSRYPAQHCHGFQRPPLRCRPRQQPDRNFRPGRQVPRPVETVRPAEGPTSATTSFMWATRSRMKRPIRRSSKASASAASRTAKSRHSFHP